ncbi:glycerophosphoryl diester phosphodiesterase [Rhodoligotrophos appendicifer]|uniref:glycerophosphodiester phosphodiesterase family protein n=1 Tax=Rhodoligotrophos appendicifer TaxID=987056 RepID=UPI001185131F|nr:glycerophosphodiester phosphodiesterase family protein [Rhodoligotrophos appendicifer]
MRWAPGQRSLHWLVERPVAHRGLHNKAEGVIENTPSAVDAAIAAGYAVEVDLQLTADGDAIVFHDPELGRLTDGSGPVRSHSVDALKRFPIKDSADRIQTFDELLRQVDGRVPLLIEIKSQWDGCGPLEGRVAEVLAGYDGPAALMSFDPDSVEALRHYAPWAVIGFTCAANGDVTDGEHLSIARRRDVRSLSILSRLQPDFLAHHVRGLPSALTRVYRSLGRPVLAWTVRTEADRERASQFADQIIFEGLRPSVPLRKPDRPQMLADVSGREDHHG